MNSRILFVLFSTALLTVWNVTYAQPSTRWVSSCPKGMDADSLSMFFSKWERYTNKVARHSKPCEYNDLYDSIVVNLHRSMVRTYEKYHKMQQGRKAMHPDELEFPVPKYMLLANKVKVDIYKRDFPWDMDIDETPPSIASISKFPVDTTLYFTPRIRKDKDIIPLYVIEQAQKAVISFMTEPVEHLDWSKAKDRNFSQDKWDELEARENMVQNFIEIWRYRWLWTGNCYLSERTLVDYISIWDNGYCYHVNGGWFGETRFVYWNGIVGTVEEWIS